MSGRRLLVVGSGIAGAAVAYWAAQAGWAVTVVSLGGEARQAASDVPSALLNPVRGQSGKVPPRAAEGLALTWELVERLTAEGWAVPHGRVGVVRPVPDVATQTKFERNLAELPHEWWPPEQVAGLAAGWFAALYLPQGGWLDGAALCQALLTAAEVQQLGGAVVQATAQHLTLADGTVLAADAVCWCGGSVGARLHAAAAAGFRDSPVQSHRAGTLLTLAESPAPLPLSFGGYLAPAATGGVLGATFERPAAEWSLPTLPFASLDWLLHKGHRLSHLQDVHVTGQWSGTRLSGLRAGRGADGVWELTGLGSKGYLLGPLLARDLVATLEMV